MGATEGKREHQIILIKRAEMSVSGVCEVISFDEENVRLKSAEGELFIEGSEIKIGALDTEKGVVTLSGKINGFYYEDEDKGERKGFFSRLSH